MIWRERPGGNQGIGYYTNWEKCADNGCIYCGKQANTREHVPSKAFLIKPYPTDLPTVPACYECNNGFSEDEVYTSCCIDILKETVCVDYSRTRKTVELFKRRKSLKDMIEGQIKIKGEKVILSVEWERIYRILIKLARGHAGFALDYVLLDADPEIKLLKFKSEMSDNELSRFEEMPCMDIIPEIGCRFSASPVIVQNSNSGEAILIVEWEEVQENQYRYQVYFDDNSGELIVKIVIYEFLYCMIAFETN